MLIRLSSIIMAALEQSQLFKRVPRANSTLNLFSQYDANIIGGLLQGLGMALSGACTGTVLVQVAMGIKSGMLTFAGATLGGILWARYGENLKKHFNATGSQQQKPAPVESHASVPDILGISTASTLLLFEAMYTVVIGAVSQLQWSPVTRDLLHPTIGGTVIGLSQGVSILVSGGALGSSTTYEQLGQWFWYLLGRVPSRKHEGTPSTRRPSTTALQTASGVVLGAMALRFAGLISHFHAIQTEPMSAASALLGGVLLGFGSRLAGGCTSGHGISGTSMFGVSSLITVAAMFAGGFGSAALLGGLQRI